MCDVCACFKKFEKKKIQKENTKRKRKYKKKIQKEKENTKLFYLRSAEFVKTSGLKL
jgi:hypothetical protein